MNRYKTTFRVKCPNDDDSIDYMLIIESDEMIMVEDINKAINIKTGAFHESIADGLFALLGGKQTITARHQGVTITTHRGGTFDDLNRLQKSIEKAFTRFGLGNWKAAATQIMKDMQ